MREMIESKHFQKNIVKNNLDLQKTVEKNKNIQNDLDFEYTYKKQRNHIPKGIDNCDECVQINEAIKRISLKRIEDVKILS